MTNVDTEPYPPNNSPLLRVDEALVEEAFDDLYHGDFQDFKNAEFEAMHENNPLMVLCIQGLFAASHEEFGEEPAFRIMTGLLVGHHVLRKLGALPTIPVEVMDELQFRINNPARVVGSSAEPPSDEAQENEAVGSFRGIKVSQEFDRSFYQSQVIRDLCDRFSNLQTKSGFQFMIMLFADYIEPDEASQQSADTQPAASPRVVPLPPAVVSTD